MPESDVDDYEKQRRYSYPLTPRTRKTVADPEFKTTLQEIKKATKD